MAKKSGIFLLSVLVVLFVVVVWAGKVFLTKKKASAPSGTTTALPADRTLPSVLVRLDHPEASRSGTSSAEALLPVDFSKIFNTVDEEGKYFLYGFFKTSGGRFLASGIVDEIREESPGTISLKLIDELGQPLASVVTLTLGSDGTFPVGLKNTPEALDFRQPVTVSPTQFPQVQAKLARAKVVIELANLDSFRENAAALKGTIIYLKE